MTEYWSLFLFFLVGALLGLRRPAEAMALPSGSQRKSSPSQGVEAPRRAGIMFALGLVLMTLMIGLRHEVGADWFAYERMFKQASLFDFGRNLQIGDPGYQLLNWVVNRAGGELWAVNLISAALFVCGLGRLARSQPDPWLVALVAVPYLTIVVAMGYTRQAAALGIIMAGIASVIRGNGLFRFAVYVFVAALFHRTSIVVLPLMTLVHPRSRATDILLMVSLTAALYVLFLQDSVEDLRRTYLEARYSSQGAAIRVAQVALAAGAFFVFQRRLGFDDRQGRLWRNFSLAALATLVALLLSPSSTMVDRLSLYLIPMQIVVIARLPVLFANPVIVRLVLAVYCALVLFVWLNYAAHAQYWLPYQTIFAEGNR